MAARPTEIDLRGKSLEEVTKLLKDNGFSASWTNLALWGGPGEAVRIVWIEDDQAPMLTVTTFNSMKVTLEPGMNLHLADHPEGLLPGQDWFTAKMPDATA